MKFFSKSKESNKQRKQTVLFVCVENAGRSQMAEGFFKMHALDKYDGISAGTRPVGVINPIATEVMKEIGIDISNQKPKILTEDTIKDSSIRVNTYKDPTQETKINCSNTTDHNSNTFDNLLC